MTAFRRLRIIAFSVLTFLVVGLPMAVYAQAKGGIDDPRSATNDAKVLFRTDCPGLFIPRVFESKFQGVVPGYTMYAVNKSKKRYSVKYDMLYTKRGDGMLLKGRRKSLSSEKEFNIRPNTMLQLWLSEKVKSPYTVESIDKIEVFECVGRETMSKNTAVRLL